LLTGGKSRIENRGAKKNFGVGIPGNLHKEIERKR
jgi:hypothetical protein